MWPGLSDYTPAGQNSIFATADTLVRFDTAAGSWGPSSPSPTGGTPGTWLAGAAWIGNNLYVNANSNVFRYDIAAGSWNTALAGVAAAIESQNAHDDSGHAFVVTSDDRIATYDTATNMISYQAFGMLPLAAVPRAAWDSVSHLLFVMPNLNFTNLYSFDPATGAIRSLTAIPSSPPDPIFCSDRSGHIYATAGVSGTSIYQYRIATDTWAAIPDMPFSHGQNGSCTVTDNGYLYVIDGQSPYNVARLQLF